MDEAQWRHTTAVNLDAVFGLVQAAVGQMLRQSELTGPGAGRETRTTAGPETGAPASGGARGHIVLISSTAGQRGEAFHADYAVTKGALISLTKSLSTELAPQGIRVNCVAPGWVATDMTAATLADAASGPKIAAAIPLGRVANAREIAGPIVFLCTPLAGFISGEVLNVNGGAVLAG
jgi:3-oxoacyl-[acyl-carrier protein] reductase